MNDNDDDDERISAAIAEQGSSNRNTPSGPISTLLTEFAREEKISAIAKAFIRFRTKYSANAGFVQEAIPVCARGNSRQNSKLVLCKGRRD